MTDTDSSANAPQTPAVIERVPLGWKLFTAFLMLACVALCVQVLWLVKLNRQLQAPFEEAIESFDSTGLVIGEYLLTLEPYGFIPATNAHNPLDFEDGRPATLLVLMGGGCQTCELSLPYFNTLKESFEGSGLEFIGVELDAKSGDDLRYSAKAKFPVIAVPGAETTWLRRIPRVPSAVIVDNNAMVRRTWFGALSARQQRDLHESLSEAERGWPTDAPQPPNR